MFGKLIKYEIKAAGKWYLGLYGLVLIIATLLGFLIKSFSDKWIIPAPYYASGQEIPATTAQDTIFSLVIMIFIGLLVALFISTLLLIIRRFSKNLYGREGYLTLTLPVSTHAIIWAKLLTSFGWVVLNGLVLFASFLLLMLPSMGMGNFLIALPRIRPYLFESHIWIFLAMLTVGFVLNILTIYLSISIGQLFQDRRGLMGVVSFFGLNIAMGFIGNLLGSVYTSSNLYISDSFFFFSNSFMLITLTINLVLAVLFYFATHYIVKNKLNIQ